VKRVLINFLENPEAYKEITLPASIKERLETAVITTLHHMNCKELVELSLVLTSNEEIQHLNRDYLGYDKPTDVLSFPAGEPIPGLPEEASHYLGDIIIAVPYAAAQAAKAGHSLLDELQLLTIHGVLHLLGMDHLEPEDKAEMWAAQTAVLHTLGIAHVTPTEE
jgi:probable rRNA maturation factor